MPEVPPTDNRAPPLAADAPASRVGSVINDSQENPLFCLVQLWACRKRCESCENAFCQATFADRTAAFHTRHRCRDCKRAEGRAAASQQSSWQHQAWESAPAWDSWNESWTESWGENWGRPAKKVHEKRPLDHEKKPFENLKFGIQFRCLCRVRFGSCLASTNLASQVSVA